DHLTLRATSGWSKEGPDALEASASFSVSPALLRRLGLADLAASLRAPVQGTASAQGNLLDLSAQAALVTAGGSLRLEGRRQGARLQASVESAGLQLGRVLVKVD